LLPRYAEVLRDRAMKEFVTQLPERPEKAGEREVPVPILLPSHGAAKRHDKCRALAAALYAARQLLPVEERAVLGRTCPPRARPPQRNH